MSSIPDESDQMSTPSPRTTADGGCLRCVEYESVCEVLHSLRGRMAVLEQRAAMLLERVEALECADAHPETN